MRVLPLLCFLLCNLVSPLLYAQEGRLVALYEDAKRHESAGNYKDAAADYEEIIRLRPGMAEAYANAANLYYLQGDAVRATPYFQKAIRLRPSLSGPHFFLGVLAFKARNYTPALKYLNDAIALDPGNPLIQSYLGYTFFATHQYSDSAKYLELAGRASPADLDIFYHLSKAYGNLAKTYYQQLQSAYPDSFYTALARAHLYESQESWELARQQYTAALKHHPADRRLQMKRDEMDARLADHIKSPDSVSALRDDTDGSLYFFYNPPAGAQIQTELAAYQTKVSTRNTSSLDPAEMAYQQAEDYQILSYLCNQWIFDQGPDSYRAHQIKGQYYEELNTSDDKAISEYRKAAELSPELPNIHFLIGNLYWRREKPEEALPELKKQLESDPDHPEALYELGDIFLANGHLNEAESYLSKSLSINPRMEEAHLALARIYTERHYEAKALVHLQKAAEISPADPTPHYKLSMIYKALGRNAESQAELRTFATLKGGESVNPR